MPTVALDRRFFEWCEGELSDPDLVRRFGRVGNLSTWEDVSARRRVVILAEAGTLRRFDDMQHDLLYDDFAQGATLQGLPDENAVQNWIADRLNVKKGLAYSVERESHVVDEKEPDVRLRAKAGGASVPIEIKVPESWTLKELEAALIDQLCGQYLRARDARHGILLLVHKKPRSKGWQDTETGAFLTFSEVVSRLEALAVHAAGAAPDAAQPEISVLDVSRTKSS